MQDTSGPQLSKEDVVSMMKSNKRLDEVQPNMVLNETIIDHYHKVDLESPLPPYDDICLPSPLRRTWCP